MRCRRSGRALWVMVAAVALALAVGPNASATSGTLVITANTTLTEDHNGTISIWADDVTLDCADHRISGPGSAGIRIDSRRGITVRNCDVSGFFHGIVMLGASETTVSGNRAHDNTAAGIVMDQNSMSNIVAGNTVVANGHNGIQISFSHGNTIRGNRAENNAGTGGIALGGSNDNVVSGNTSTGNANFGITLDGAGNSVASNVVTSNGTIGSFGGGIAVFANSTDSLITDNLVSENNEGIRLHGADRAVVSGNRALGNRGFGFVVLESNNGDVIENAARGNGGVGFLLESSSQNALRSNKARDNAEPGFWLRVGANENVLEDNHAIRNSEGFVVDIQSTRNTLIANTALENQNTGYWVRDGSHGTVMRRNLSQANTWGIVVWDIESSTFEANSIMRNGGGGIGLERADGNELVGNATNGNYYFGIWLYESDRNVIGRNVANANTDVGIGLFAGSSNNEVDGNVARGNGGVDGVDDLTGAGNAWTNNNFGTTSGL
jgi:parallel beta-helix repeat protein